MGRDVSGFGWMRRHEVNVPKTSLMDVFAALPAPPCEKFGCAWVGRCRDEQLACAAFVTYASTGIAVAPNVPAVAEAVIPDGIRARRRNKRRGKTAPEPEPPSRALWAVGL
jgi:hypothetical protein